MFHSSIVTNVSFYTQNYYNSKYFVKSTTTLAWIWQITQKGWFFALIFDYFTKPIFARASLVTFGTSEKNLLSCVQNNCKYHH